MARDKQECAVNSEMWNFKCCCVINKSSYLNLRIKEIYNESSDDI